MRPNPGLDVAQAMTELAVGGVLGSLLRSAPAIGARDSCSVAPRAKAARA
ncbi:hypothetical protein [Thiomonas sp. X19]